MAVTVSLSVTEDQYGALKTIAAKHRISITALLYAIVVDAVADEGFVCKGHIQARNHLTKEQKLEIASRLFDDSSATAIKALADEFRVTRQAIYSYRPKHESIKSKRREANREGSARSGHPPQGNHSSNHVATEWPGVDS